MNANADLDLDPKIQMGILILKDMRIYEKDMRINNSHSISRWEGVILIDLTNYGQ